MNGYQYIGNWVNGKKHGYGMATLANSTFEGEWIDDIKSDYGKYTFPNGDYFVGTVVNREMQGFGIYCYTNGKKYEGEFVNNRYLIGRWTERFGDFFDANWKNGKPFVITRAELTKVLLCGANSIPWEEGGWDIHASLYLRSVLKIVAKITPNGVIQQVINTLKYAGQREAEGKIKV